MNSNWNNLEGEGEGDQEKDEERKKSRLVVFRNYGIGV